ncbi:uncharacterized protein SPAPADRAFT_51724 [Spathaspora passalidarum NRRL Y-27907]|uniref:Hyphally-regulated cell wall protein N-terminal domain-containing protein n=1 Tax=Spathaspora passalidarum (strain NRRL Y-27907 / 11-Y1) TaxID=619300 RepID=G3ARD6_SPAPN|nr:uncharacterized protein SPAPADRAFT_51724 [Spathaspora passalidarum NRRL Y-27907]EGW31743.1 hypothetical protein SPAPADRAFT_51724 [Spathaspora passalidarum NRRL Y-27907]
MKLLASLFLFLTSVIALDVSSTTTITSASVLGESYLIESTGVLELLNSIQLYLTSLTVRSLGQFFFLADSLTNIDIQTMDNSGYVLFDLPDSTYLPFRSNSRNSGEFVVNTGHSIVDFTDLDNTGSLTLWATFYTGPIAFFHGLVNTGNICLHEFVSNIENASGKGCYALSQSTVYIQSAASDFEPTVVFEDPSNGFYIVNTPQVLRLKLINFGNGNFIGFPNQGYITMNYFSGSGYLVVYIAIYEIYVNIGFGYDLGLFIASSNSEQVRIKYDGSVPSGANQGGCSCSLNIRTPPAPESTIELETSSEVSTSSSIEITSSSVVTSTSSSVAGSTYRSSTKSHSSSKSCPTPKPTNGHGNNGNGHDNNHGNGHDNNHGNNSNGNNHGNDNHNGNGNSNNHDNHDNGHGKEHNDGHTNGNGNNNHNDNHGNGNSNNNNNNHGNSKGKSNNNNGNGKGNDKGGGNGKGHKRRDVLDNSACSTHKSMLVLASLVFLAIV